MSALVILACCMAGSLVASEMLARRSPRLGFVARPDPTVPNHTRDTPLLGGVGIVACVMVATGLAGLGTAASIAWLAASVLMFGLGFYKDLVGEHVSPIPQLVAQSAGVGIASFGASLTTFHDASLATWMFAIVAGLALVNSINFLDVMDGLAGGTCLISALGFAIVLRQGDDPAAVIAIALAGGIAGFLTVNIHPARIFMGDIGSFGIGVTLFGLALRTWPLHGPWIPLLLLAVPLAELGTTITFRLVSGTSPFRGDGNHASLRLLRKGWTVLQITGLFWVMQAACLAVALALV